MASCTLATPTPPRGAEHEHDLPRLEGGAILQGKPGGLVDQPERRRLLGRDASGGVEAVSGGNAQLLGIGAVLDLHGDEVAGLEGADAFADGGNATGGRFAG